MGPIGGNARGRAANAKSTPPRCRRCWRSSSSTRGIPSRPSLSPTKGAVAGWTPNLHFVRALVLERLADHAGALAEYRWLLDFHGKRTEAPVQPGITGSTARLGCARALEAMGISPGPRRRCAGSSRSIPAFRGARELARILNVQGRAAEARGVLDAYLKRSPHDGEAWALSGKLAFEGAPEAALKRFEIAASAFDAPGWVLRELAITKAILGDWGRGPGDGADPRRGGEEPNESEARCALAVAGAAGSGVAVRRAVAVRRSVARPRAGAGPAPVK